ncbi:hypothetical protein OAB94_02195 [Flavobacteriaceae bacterium]|nr:hypothetical protein [Flavobacteriaceae bacterium]
MDGIFESLRKKDPDMLVVDVDTENDVFIINTNIPEMPTGLYEILEENDTEENEQPQASVDIQIIKMLYMGNMLISFVVLTFGIVPYLLLNTISKENAVKFLIGLLVTNIVAYVIMTLNKSIASLMFWAFSLAMLLGGTCSITNDVAILQCAAIVFLQNVVVVIYAILSPRGIVVWKTVLAMLLFGIIVWTVGIYAFVEQHDWISASIVFILIVAFTVYSALQLQHIDRYSLNKEHMIQAMVNFYTDPVYLLFRCESMQM